MFPLFSKLPFFSAILVTSVCMAFLYSSPIVAAAPSVERVTFQLNGPRCNVQHAKIISTLSPLPGVRAVDLSSVPGHALIDIDTETISGQNLIENVRKLWRDEASCLVEPMQSCISANPFDHIGRSSTSHVGTVH